MNVWLALGIVWLLIQVPLAIVIGRMIERGQR